MNIIDQRILIPTSSDIVWGYVSELSNNPDWQANCRSMSFLTTTRAGKDVRWRGAAKNGREYVVQITAWYDRIGYEYKIVDGTPYKENMGRIRLQEVPEGTIVQWTFRYDMSGILRGIRNTVSTKRNVENAIVNSLWALWRRVTEVKPVAQSTNYASKSLMREAPDVQARSQYVPRHPLKVTEAQPPEGVSIKEPPISDDDTRPHDVVPAQSEDATPSPPVTPAEPDFLKQITDEKVQVPHKPISFETASPETSVAEQFRPSVDPSAIPEQQPKPTPLSTPDPAPVNAVETVPPAPFVTPLPAPHTLPELDSDIDTSQVSVFDLFGVQKPTVPAEPATPEIPKKPEAITTTSASTSIGEKPSKARDHSLLWGRIGMRLILRHKRAAIRRPTS